MRKPTHSLGAIAAIGVIGCILLLLSFSFTADKALGTGALVRTAKTLHGTFHDLITGAVCRLQPGKGEEIILAVDYTASGILPPGERSQLSKEIGQLAYFTYLQEPEVREKGQDLRIREVTITCTEEISSGCSRQTRQTTDSLGLIIPTPPPRQAPPPLRPPPAPLPPPPSVPPPTPPVPPGSSSSSGPGPR